MTTEQIKPRMDVTGKLPMTGLVAVYGTLKRGYANHRCLKGAKFVGEAVTVNRYPLIINRLPYLFNEPGKGALVKVEVFDVADPAIMERLDYLESHPRFYTRTETEVILRRDSEDGEPISQTKVFIYFVNRKFDDADLPGCTTEFNPPIRH